MRTILLLFLLALVPSLGLAGGPRDVSSAEARELIARNARLVLLDVRTPEGREVCFERNYLWEHEAGGDIRVEVNVYEPHAHEEGVSLSRTISREAGDLKEFR